MGKDTKVAPNESQDGKKESKLSTGLTINIEDENIFPTGLPLTLTLTSSALAMFLISLVSF